MDSSVVVAIVSAVLAALVGWLSGLFKWIGRFIDQWRNDRRRLMPQAPKRTLLIAIDYALFPPFWGSHDFGEGRTATLCHAGLVLNNLSDRGELPSRADVRVRQWPWLRRGAFTVRLDDGNSSSGRPMPIAGHDSRRGWMLTFFVWPELGAGETLRVDVFVYDSYGNAHVVKDVRFTHGLPAASPPF